MEALEFRLEKVVKSRDGERQDFQGPLDLILHLLGQNKMEIQDIQISLILAQYLAYLKRQQEMDLEIASDFITMAAQLIYIKTRMLLTVGDEVVPDEMQQLIQSLEERQRGDQYVKIKAVAQTLGARYINGCDYLTRPPEPAPGARAYEYAHDSGDLRRAMAGLLARVNGVLPLQAQAFQPFVEPKIYPVSVKAAEIIRRLFASGVVRFRALFRGSRSRSEIVATFLAVLELCGARKVRLTKGERDCTLSPMERTSLEKAEIEEKNAVISSVG